MEREFVLEGKTLLSYRGGAVKVTIPDGVTEIAGRRPLPRTYDANSDRYLYPTTEGAFEGNAALQTVVLPASIRKIGEGAFCGCRALTSVELPEDLEEIGADAFRECGKLETLVLPQGLRRIGRQAFQDCEALRRAVLPPEIQEIGDRAFSYCAALEEVCFEKNRPRIGGGVWEGCWSLRTVQAPWDIPEQAFCASAWFVARMTASGRCPACGWPLQGRSPVCSNLRCPTNYGKWER